MFDLSGQTILVAGGAGHLGTPVCETIVKLGGRVFIADINRERLDAALTSVAALGGADTVDGAILDIGEENSINAAVSACCGFR